MKLIVLKANITRPGEMNSEGTIYEVSSYRKAIATISSENPVPVTRNQPTSMNLSGVVGHIVRATLVDNQLSFVVQVDDDSSLVDGDQVGICMRCEMIPVGGNESDLCRVNIVREMVAAYLE